MDTQNMELQPIRLSDFYWSLGIIVSLLGIILYDTEKNSFFAFFAIGIFILTLFLGHNEKLKNKLDYKEVKK